MTFFTLTWFPDGKYVFDLVTPRPVTLQPNLLANFAPGIYDTVTTGGVTFDGLAFSSTGPTNFRNTNANPERLNVSGGGFGIGNANLDDNEGFMFVRSGTDALGFDLIFQTATTINVSWAAYGGGTPPTSASVPTQTGSLVVNDDADHTVPVTIDPTADFNYIVVRFDSVRSRRVQNFSYQTSVIPSDTTVSFGVTYTDGDGDLVAGSTTTDSQKIDILLAGNATTTFNGDSGEDWFTGTLAGQTFNGNGGNDTVDYSGSNAGVSINLLADTASGGHAAGDNLNSIENLVGSSQGDTLIGDNGANVLRGDAGLDLMTGNGGADVYRFTLSTDSGNTQVTADRIIDFNVGEASEVIDLAAIDANVLVTGDQSFMFLNNVTPLVDPGVTAFSVTWFQSGGNTFVQADTTGDTAADIMIRLDGSISLTAGDFIL